MTRRPWNARISAQQRKADEVLAEERGKQLKQESIDIRSNALDAVLADVEVIVAQRGSEGQEEASLLDVAKVKPTLEEVRDFVRKLVELSHHGWIGEGEEIAQELLDYIDGDNLNVLDPWQPFFIQYGIE